MLTFEEAYQALNEISDTIPQEIYRHLNGGIILLPDIKLHPKSRGNGLYTLGEYHFEPNGFGRYITLYYGSFCRTYGYLSNEAFRKKLMEVLYHELTHHLEHLAGDKTLEIKDHEDIARYMANQSSEKE